MHLEMTYPHCTVAVSRLQTCTVLQGPKNLLRLLADQNLDITEWYRTCAVPVQPGVYPASIQQSYTYGETDYTLTLHIDYRQEHVLKSYQDVPYTPIVTTIIAKRCLIAVTELQTCTLLKGDAFLYTLLTPTNLDLTEFYRSKEFALAVGLYTADITYTHVHGSLDYTLNLAIHHKQEDIIDQPAPEPLLKYNPALGFHLEE